MTRLADPPATMTTKAASKGKQKKVKKDVESMKLTDFYHVRRSARKTGKEIEAEVRLDLRRKIETCENETDLIIEDFEAKGRGIRAGKKFEKGDFVCEYKGEIIKFVKAREREANYSKDPKVGSYMYYFQHNNAKWCVDATEESRFKGRLINHSFYSPNLKTKVVDFGDNCFYLCLFALRDIEEGEELLVSALLQGSTVAMKTATMVVIGISRDEFSKSELSKLYRKLARQFHPDRIRDKEKLAEAEEKFRLVTTAYETLKDDETRGYYDYYLDHPEERYYNYYQYYRMRAAPKVDVRLVIFVTVMVISIVQYVSAKQKFSEAVSYAATQVKFRNVAMDVARERNLLEFDEKGKPKKKQKNGADVEKVIQSIIEENINVSGGYKRASLLDTFAVQIIIFPKTLTEFLIQRGSLAYRQLMNKDLTHDDKLFLIKKNMGLSAAQFGALDEGEVEDFLAMELWKKDLCEEYKKKKEVEEKEKLMNSGRYKQYKRYMKRNAGNTISFLED
ncbi:hypothetical protein FO519_003016 [Halicephalobus sp. NKZ332]|nr:hypothetical protein FO519_003016 [Halicephalobus sp. NKZ332]